MRKAAFYFTLLTGVFSLAAHGQRQAEPPASPAFPAANMINLRSVDASGVRTPEIAFRVQGSTVRDGRREWLQVSAEFDTAPNWIDEMTVSFYVVLRANPSDLAEGANPVNMFSGNTTYVNVKQSRRQSVSMFLDPNTFERFGSVEAVAVLINIDGRPAAARVEPQRTAASRWWETQQPNAIPLLRRDQTPWSVVEIEQNLTIRP